MEEVSRSCDDWRAGGYPSPDTVEEVLQRVSTLNGLKIADVYARDSDDDWKIVPVSVSRHMKCLNILAPPIPAPTLEELVRNVRTFGCLHIVSNAVESETEAWCNGFEGIGSTVADAVLRLYAKLLANKREREDRATQSDRMEEDPNEKLRDEFLSYGWAPRTPEGTDTFCAEKLVVDAYNEVRHVVIAQDAEGMWYAEVYKNMLDSPCLKITFKYRSHVALLKRLDEMMQGGSLDDWKER